MSPHSLVTAALERGRGRASDEPAIPAARSTRGLKDMHSDGVLRACSRPDCRRTIHAKGLCRVHYKRHRAGASLDLPIRKSRWSAETPCLAPGCARPSDRRGLCTMHYQRKRDGVPLDLPPRVTRRGPEVGFRVKATIRLTRKARAEVVAEAERQGVCVANVLRQVVESWAGERV